MIETTNKIATAPPRFVTEDRDSDDDYEYGEDTDYEDEEADGATEEEWEDTEL